ncbi:hypothetical protein A2Z53_02065 [Candidatus Giovannonibacteria bacterium RIFCSPHIGHO2_02_42_15]|uniref:Uncharacterized protein n=2 Tax=Candidatus Giovannoniibacteriota TaxID=1752738 RepID=A0A1F5VLW9_9BACT|nr:MAG: hypothetical protein UV11_C0003G0005 [Candidatus Giovannonibacteria bacterium GW2011_GWF2_42_19]OGF63981.1 MAG: hypothetical protein A2Z53_02065 [Candidatus Giovannonibacteria bacterium RIFCSPHIGHO2_02_42_15]
MNAEWVIIGVGVADTECVRVGPFPKWTDTQDFLKECQFQKDPRGYLFHPLLPRWDFGTSRREKSKVEDSTSPYKICSQPYEFASMLAHLQNKQPP